MARHLVLTAFVSIALAIVALFVTIGILGRFVGWLIYSVAVPLVGLLVLGAVVWIWLARRP